VFEVTKKNFEEDKKALAQLHHECMSRAADFEDEMKTEDEELKAVSTAKKVLIEMTGGAEKATYSPGTVQDLVQTSTIVSFLQTKRRNIDYAKMPG
jgi:hypothetical protein